MLRLNKFLYAFSCLLAGVAVTVAVTRYRPETALELAIGAGIAAALFGLLMLEIVIRRSERSILVAALDAERQDREAFENRTQDQFRVLAGMLETLNQRHHDEELVREMRLVRSQLSRLSSRRAKGTRGDVSAPSGESVLQGDDLISAIEQAFSENRIDLYLQPIVELPQRHTLFHECLTRLRDPSGGIIPPSQYLPVAEEMGLAGIVDNLSLLRCVQSLRRQRSGEQEHVFFCNLSTASLTDQDFFEQFEEYLAGNYALAGRIIFEVNGDLLSLAGSDVVSRLKVLRRLGFELSVDHIGDTGADFGRVIEIGAKYVKVDANGLLGEQDRVAGALKLKNQLKSQGIELIASKIETEPQVVDLLDADIGFAQGYLFGEPRPMRDAA